MGVAGMWLPHGSTACSLFSHWKAAQVPTFVGMQLGRERPWQPEQEPSVLSVALGGVAALPPGAPAASPRRGTGTFLKPSDLVASARGAPKG